MMTQEKDGAAAVVTAREVEVLRGLARRVAERAALPVQRERIRLWKNHNDLRRPVRPLLYISPEGAWRELVPDETLSCQNGEARYIERSLRERLYADENFLHDVPVVAEWLVNKVVHNSGWGLEVKRVPSTAARGSWHFLQTLCSPADVRKITLPQISYDRAQSEANLARAREIFDGILPVRLVGVKHISFHLMKEYTNWRGLEEALYDMYEEPELIHEVMEILVEGHLQELRQYEEQGLLDLNNDGTYHNSGGFGWSDELPAPGFDPARVRLCDMWGSAESQEMAPVGPRQHADFALEYEKRLLAGFGRTGYGCCEDLTQKLDDVFAIPHIRRISISPWADVAACAERMGDRYVFSWKPQPAHLVGRFNAEAIRQYLRGVIEICKGEGNFLEIILKDTHTCEQHPERFNEWARIAREEIDRAYPEHGFPFAQE